MGRAVGRTAQRKFKRFGVLVAAALTVWCLSVCMQVYGTTSDGNSCCNWVTRLLRTLVGVDAPLYMLQSRRAGRAPSTMPQLGKEVAQAALTALPGEVVAAIAHPVWDAPLPDQKPQQPSVELAKQLDISMSNSSRPQSERPLPSPQQSTTAILLEIYRKLCEWGATRAEKVKTLSAQQRDKLVFMYAPIVEAPPVVPLRTGRPGGRLSAEHADCTSKKFSSILSGYMQEKGPRTIVDVFTGTTSGAELDLLELRLHELDGVADVVMVVESRFGAHGDLKPLHFERQKTRFTHFLPKIKHLVLEELCSEYAAAAEALHTTSPSQRSSELLDALSETRMACLLRAVWEREPQLPDDALVILGSPEEIPWGPTVNTLKHCQLRDSVSWPLRLQMQEMRFNLRTGCPLDLAPHTKATVSSMKQLRVNNTSKTSYLLQPGQIILRGGARLNSVGSRPQVDYRFLHHKDSGQIAPLVVPENAMTNVCAVRARSVVDQLQRALTQSPISVFLNSNKPTHTRVLAAALSVEKLDRCDIPWALRINPRRYPFLWGDGQLS